MSCRNTDKLTLTDDAGLLTSIIGYVSTITQPLHCHPSPVFRSPPRRPIIWDCCVRETLKVSSLRRQTSPLHNIEDSLKNHNEMIVLFTYDMMEIIRVRHILWWVGGGETEDRRQVMKLHRLDTHALHSINGWSGDQPHRWYKKFGVV